MESVHHLLAAQIGACEAILTAATGVEREGGAAGSRSTPAAAQRGASFNTLLVEWGLIYEADW